MLIGRLITVSRLASAIIYNGSRLAGRDDEGFYFEIRIKVEFIPDSSGAGATSGFFIEFRR